MPYYKALYGNNFKSQCLSNDCSVVPLPTSSEVELAESGILWSYMKNMEHKYLIAQRNKIGQLT